MEGALVPVKVSESDSFPQCYSVKRILVNTVTKEYQYNIIIYNVVEYQYSNSSSHGTTPPVCLKLFVFISEHLEERIRSRRSLVMN